MLVGYRCLRLWWVFVFVINALGVLLGAYLGTTPNMILAVANCISCVISIYMVKYNGKKISELENTRL